MTGKASNIQDEGDGAEKSPEATLAYDDDVLVAGVRRGDMNAFGSLVAKYQDRIYNTVYHVCQNNADAEELTQEAFLKALEKISQFRGHSKFYTWLFRIGVNLAISQQRKKQRIRLDPIGDDGRLGGQADKLRGLAGSRGDCDPQRQVIAEETRRCVAEAIAELDDDWRVVVILRDIENMSYSQMAHVLGINVGTVRSRLYRARCALGEMLGDRVEQR